MSTTSRAAATATLFVAALFPWPCEGSAQTGSLSGRVLDLTSGRPIAAAEVTVGGTDLTAITQQNGSYFIEGVLVGPAEVSVRRIGYEGAIGDVTVASESTSALDFRLRAEPLRLDDIVVTGMPRGTRRRAVGNAVTRIPVADITQDAPATTFQELLAGRVPGLRFSRLSGNLGTGSPLSLRGIGSFDLGRSQPLVYVDGIRVSTDVAAGPPIGSGRSVNILDDFGLEEVESIEIIQGAAAGSLYGSDAASGIIHIITPKGQLGPPELTATIREGVNYLSNPAERLGTQWYCSLDPAPGPAECQNEEDLRPFNMYQEASDYIRQGYFDWPSEDLFSGGRSRSYGLSVRGGTTNARYFLSGAYDDEQGMVPQNTDETIRARGNVGVTLNERFAVDLSMGYVTGRASLGDPAPGFGGIWQDLAWSQGFYLDRASPFGSTGNCIGSGCSPNVRLGGFHRHLPTDVAQVESTRDYTRFTGSGTLSFSSPSWSRGSVSAAIRSRAVLGLDKGWDVNRNLFPRADGLIPESVVSFCQRILFPCTPQSWSTVYSESGLGLMNYERPVASSLTAEWGVTADLGVGASLAFATSAGVQYYHQERELFANWGQGFASPASRTINHISQSSITTVYQGLESKSIGFYVQEEVGFADRIFLTGALRRDENSSFGDDVAPRLYPKVAAAWIVSEESFWGLDAVQSLRLRGAWGKAGRPPAALAGVSTFIALGGSAEQLALRPERVGNTAIEPEVSTELELGFDFAALDGRVAGSFSRHSRRNEGGILDVIVISSLGIPGPQARNLGRIDTWGWEASLQTRLYENTVLSLGLDLAADHVDNEIMDLDAYPGTPSIALGVPYPNQLNDDLVLGAAFDPAGPVFSAFGQGISAVCDEGVRLAPDPAAPDANRYARVPGGAAVPCQSIPNQNLVVGRAFASHTFSVAPRIGLFDDRLQVFALAEGQYGRLREANDKENRHVFQNSKVARLQNDPAWAYGFAVGDDTKRSLYDADFWKLREVGARFTVPDFLTRRVGAERASLSFAARNLWTIWKAQSEIYGVPITDPEFGSPSLDGDNNPYESPPLTNVSVTLRVTF
jgi:hypothetical protein